MGILLTGRTSYRLHERISRGGMATVHLGTMIGPAGERRVAIKQLAAEDALDETARRRLVDEARLVFRLTHANICQVFDLASSHEGTFVVMELVEGLDLRALVSRSGPLDLPNALYIAREVAQALDYAHRRCDDVGQPLLLVHGDVKPANVLLSCEGEVKLADFGIARALGRMTEGPRVLAGTRGFIAPELKLHATSQRADLYALGVTLYVALTGIDPGTSGFAPRALRRARPDASVELERLIARATAPDPGARFGSAAQLEKALALELARQFAEFTPSSLARVVRRHYAVARNDPEAQNSDSVLESMTEVTVDARGARDAALAPRGGAEPQHGTQTVAAIPTRRWQWIAAPAVVLAISVTYLAWPHSRSGMAPVPAEVASRTESAHVITRVEIDAGVVDRDGDQDSPSPSREDRSEIIRSRDLPAVAKREPPPHAGRIHRESPPRDVVKPVAPRDVVKPDVGFVTVTARRWGAVYIDDKQVTAETPLYRHPLPAGTHRVKLFQPSTGEYSSVQQLEVRPGEVAQLSFK